MTIVEVSSKANPESDWTNCILTIFVSDNA
jgi:hypothetical protein